MGHERLIADLQERIKIAYRSPDKFNKHNQIAEFGQHLRHKYSDPTEYTLFHILVSSTPVGTQPFFDFPGEDSVEKFIKEKL